MDTMRNATHSQQPLWSVREDDGFVAGFRALYYDLYTNSSSSRAERIIEDLSLLLLLKLASEQAGRTELFDAVAAGDITPEEAVQTLSVRLPDLVAPGQRFTVDPKSIRRACADIASLTLSGAPSHALGEAFQAIMGPRLRGEKGQFFTPLSLVRTMVQIVDPQPGESVLDPACGTAGFLRESHVYVQETYGSDGKPLVLVGIDKDFDLYRLASALMAIAVGPSATVRNMNSLDHGDWFAAGLADSQFDVILTNPPFGSKIGLSDAERLATFSLGHQWIRDDQRWRPTKSLLATQDPQTLFLELCVRRLKPGGRLGIVLPEGVFGNKGSGFIWEWLRSQGTIEALLDCPRTTFQPGTDTKTNVLFFRRHHSETASPATHARVAVALACGHDRRGRTTKANGASLPDDFTEIGRDFHRPQPEAIYWRRVELTNPDYLVPRYYEPPAFQGEAEQRLIGGATLATIGELVESETLFVRKGHEPGSEAYGTGPIPFVRTSDISNFEVSTDPTKSVSEEVFNNYSRHQDLRPLDLLLVVDGRYRIGASALLSTRNFRCVVQSHLRIISVRDESVLTPFELLYAMNLPFVRRRMRDLVFVQSTLGTIGSRLMELSIPILHGDGPWSPKVAEFETLLRQRDDALAKLAAMASSDVEL